MSKPTLQKQITQLRAENNELKRTVQNSVEAVEKLSKRGDRWRQTAMDNEARLVELTKDFNRLCQAYDLVRTTLVRSSAILMAEGINPNCTDTVNTTTHTPTTLSTVQDNPF